MRREPSALDEIQDSGATAAHGQTMAEEGLPVRLREGEIVADRFVIERLAGRGGMGSVYRAIDRTTGAPVALKVMTHGGQNDERFAQEVRVLSELTHPAIVRYVAHGATSKGKPFLAMEWLEGEDVAERLGHQGFSVTESVTVVRRVAEGLAVAHARGLVHRDVKPSNVFLVGGDPARTKLIDFGIVRLQPAQGFTMPPMTRTGMILGTVGYMSPEQAMADRAIDARTDIFALGCVLFECLTGKPVFSGAHVVAIFAKVLREEAPRIRALRPELSAQLDELVARMLAKDKEARPVDGGAILRELEAIGNVTGGLPDEGLRPSVGLSAGEQRFLSVMLAVVPGEPTEFSEIVLRHGADQARLANGTQLVTSSSHGGSTEQVVSAAVCALELRQVFPSARIALATGRAQTAGGPPGPVIDQAAALLAQSMSSGIRIDEVTAGLLGERFELRQDEHSQVLWGRRSDQEPPRTLLGKPTPCVGRDKELALLDLTLRECVDESVARAVLVTGPAGQGKSRLRHEFVTKARERADVTILTARADPVGASSAFLMVRQLVRQAIGLRESEPAPEQHANLRAHVADVCKNGDFARIADFLGELINAPSTGQPSPQLRVARNDPQVMGVWLARSFGEWLAAECSARPLLIVLEDLHWGDSPSVTYLGEALRALTAQPFMVLALARPEVHGTFSNLWAGAEKHDIALGRLAPRAAERLVRATLGESLTQEAVSRIVERADGNAFYLEELIRRVAEGGGDTLPETVLALVQSRLERLEPEARRIVRAASIFGEIFWRGGVAALLGNTSDHGDLEAWLKTLAEREVLGMAPESRYAGEHEYVFRHGLLRQAAYGMLTEADRTTGHRLAGPWLEAIGEKDALTLADHFERGGESKRAVKLLLRAGEAALSQSAHRDAIDIFDRGIRAHQTLPGDDADPQMELRLQLRMGGALLLAEGFGSARAAGTFERARKLCDQLDTASNTTLMPALLGIWASAFMRENVEAAAELANQALRQAERSGRPASLVWGHSVVGFTVLHIGDLSGARHHMGRAIELYVEERHRRELTEDPGMMSLSFLARAEWLSGHAANARKLDEDALALAERLDKPLDVATALTWSAMYHAMAAEPELALERATSAIRASEDLGLPLRIAEARNVRAWALSALGRSAEALEEMNRAEEVIMRTGARTRGPQAGFSIEALLNIGLLQQGMDTLDDSLATLGGWNLERSNLLRLRGELALRGVQSSRQSADVREPAQPFAERAFREAIDSAHSLDAKGYELRATLALARLLALRGEDGEGHATLDRIASAFPLGEDTRELREARAILSRRASR